MGYPMTFKRLINRGRWNDGDYTKPPEAWQIQVNIGELGLIKTDEEFIQHLGPYWRKRLQEYETMSRSFAGDLRRLEKDAVDEDAYCNVIAQRTGVPSDIVAIVIKEFIGY